MLTEDGCRARRAELFAAVETDWILLTDPRSLTSLMNFIPSPYLFNFESAAAAALLNRDGTAILIADNVQGACAERAFATGRVAPLWYRCVEDAPHRGLLLVDAIVKLLRQHGIARIGIESATCPAGVFVALAPNLVAVDISPALHQLFRRKHSDELVLIHRSIRAAEAGFKAAVEFAKPGCTEWDIYQEILAAVTGAAGEPVRLYGDFVSGPNCSKGGRASSRVIEPGDLVLLDFSVVLHGYRGDFANTFACGGKATPKQEAWAGFCLSAMAAGEAHLAAGAPTSEVHRAVVAEFARHGVAQFFGHHSGHGVGLSHPDVPYIVPASTDHLQAGDVVTLEPGLYSPEVGGMRFERNYLITASGFENLTHHSLGLYPA